LYQSGDTTDTAPSISLDDTDRNNALFLSNIYRGTAPNSTIVITAGMPTELAYSSCAALLHKVPNYSVNTTLTTRGPTNDTRQQFMVANLTQDTTYKAYMMQSSGSSTGMTLPITVYTKTGKCCFEIWEIENEYSNNIIIVSIDSNCRLIYDLPFCNQVAYSVPVSPDSYSTSDIWNISSAYDQQAAKLFDPFDVALEQFNCETTQYSLVRNCTDCYRDYKTWLCAVTIPRCTDSASSSDLSQGTDDVKAAPAIRDISAGASRNGWIDTAMAPGEWTELLPCIDLCYHVVQSCPPFMQFYCPQGDLAAVQYGFWQTGNATVNGTLYNFDVNNPTCNRMGVNASLLTISGATQITLNSFLTFCTSFMLLLYLF
jgi:calcium channel MID1